jgi:Ca2+-binding RTX toxin-like protein
LNGTTGDHLDNLGTIIGARSGVDYGQIAGGVGALNDGSIFGEFAGILNESLSDGGKFTNAGTIASSNIGIDFVTAAPTPTLTINITNLVGAGIFGPTRAILTNAILDLTNRGEIGGDVLVNNSGASVIVNKGVITGQVLLNGGGNDTFNGTGGTSGTITATGNDKIMLGKGSARVHVGGGSDIITAGPGHDQFIFDSALAGQIETIKKFTHGHDTIVLSLSDFPMLGALGQLNTGHFDFGHATKAHPEIIYNQGNGFLSYDANGNAPGGLHHFATLLGAPTISHADFTLVA